MRISSNANPFAVIWRSTNGIDGNIQRLLRIWPTATNKMKPHGEMALKQDLAR